jgi:uncharacterized membrane protein YqgA involved in biofilm formation
VLGTIVNAIAIVLGGALGLLFGKTISQKMNSILIQGLGLATLLIGAKMALVTNNPLVIIGSLIIGGVIGEGIDIEKRLEVFGSRLEEKFAGDGGGRFTKAFINTSLIYCIGAMGITGAIESGIRGTHSILMAKSLIDGSTAIVFATSMGGGVLASAIPVFLYQGAITLAASLLKDVLSQAIITEMSATGGLLIVGIGMNILGIREIKVGNLLPGIFVAIPLTFLLI